MAINLDKIDKRILFELDKNARIPDTKLAKLVGRSKESVRYRILQLTKKGIIQGFSIWIDLAKLGYNSAKIYLQLANKPEKKEAFKKFVMNDNRLFWLGIAEGSWNAGLTYFVKSNREFFELKNELFSKFKDLILESHTGMLVDVGFCEKSFLYNSETQWKFLFGTNSNYNLEAVEKNILKELFYNSRINIIDIVRKHKTTIDIVRNRIKKLENNGIIKRYLVKIDLSKLDYEFYKSFLYFKNLTKADEERLLEYTRNVPEIIYLTRQITPWDFELEIVCKSYHEYNKIISNLTKDFSDIINKVDTAIMSEDYVFPTKKMVFE